MPENNDQIKSIKIQSNEDSLTVSFDPQSETYTFKSERTGIELSLDEEKISNLISFLQNVAVPVKAYTYEEKRKEHKKAYAKWDDIEERKLTLLWESGVPISEISEKLMRNKGGIRSRLKKLGFDPSSNLNSNQNSKNEVVQKNIAPGFCRECGVQIDPKRLLAVPKTAFCIDCAGEKHFEKHKIEEPLGTREDFRKDRSSWKSTNS